MTRMVVFVDYENARRVARSCFHDHWEHERGHFHPGRLGDWIASHNNSPVELAEVRVYRGFPDPRKQPTSSAANIRQAEVWRRDPRVTTILRPLQYLEGWDDPRQPGVSPREKGIDVQLAIDFVRYAIFNRYDIGVILSTDTDLKPALETVYDLPRVAGQVAAWSGEGMHNRRLAIDQGRRLWCHWLNKDAYAAVRDDTDYSRPAGQ